MFPPEIETYILDLLFILLEWHALAKLRIHTESTISALRLSTSALGKRLRHFRDKVATHYLTLETTREVNARLRRAAAAGDELTEDQVASAGKRHRTFNLSTYKIHALGDYASAVVEFGTTDSYSTQIVSPSSLFRLSHLVTESLIYPKGELEHRRAKAQARRTNHNDIVKQMNNHDRRNSRLEARSELLASLDFLPDIPNRTLAVAEEVSYGSPDDHYHIGKDARSESLQGFLNRHAGDPAVQVCYNIYNCNLWHKAKGSLQNFVNNLKDHIYGRLAGTDSYMRDFAYSQEDRDKIVFPHDRLYHHSAVRVNYTTYDVRRAQDTINPSNSHNTIMVRSPDNDDLHPYWYAKVLGVFHVNTLCRLAGVPQVPFRMDFVWARWMEIEQLGGTSVRRLNKVRYVPNDSADAFGFVDPDLILRGCHLIPTFHNGRTKVLLPRSIAWDDPQNGDWFSYYVNRWALLDFKLYNV